LKINFHVIISGRVQGVWFRASAKQKAEQLGIKGWIRNTSDGSVEAVFEGEEKSVNEMIEWCNHGPPLSKIENVEIEKKNPTDGFKDFSIRY
jgi:acylphosphatase